MPRTASALATQDTPSWISSILRVFAFGEHHYMRGPDDRCIILTARSGQISPTS